MKQCINYLAIVTAVMTVLSISSCKKDVTPELSLSDSSVSFEIEGGSKDISVKSNVAWVVSADQNWVTIAPANGEGNNSFTITVSENTDFTSRTANVTVISGGTLPEKISISQLGLTPEIHANPATLEFEDKGGELSIQVTSNTSWNAILPDGEDWLSLNVVKGEGSAEVIVTVETNPLVEVRSAQIGFKEDVNGTIASVTISQAALVPYLEINPEEVDASSVGGDFTVSVSSNVEWTLSCENEVDWCTVDKTTGTGDGKVVFTISENILLKERSVEYIFADKVTGDTKSLSVMQGAAQPSRYTDSLALVSIYESSNGSQWAKNNWDLSQPMDTWAGIRISEETNRVDSIKLGTKTIKDAPWSLPENIGDLTELICLALPTNMVTGELPASIYDLTKLKTLELSGNTITGFFNSGIGRWTEMTYITMLNNKDFGGTIPAEIGNMKKLFRLNLSNTSISGAIPAEIAGCESMQEFMIFGAQLSGELPDVWDSFKNDFKILMLYGNTNLTGALPASLGKIQSSVSSFSIHLYNCSFTGNVPESYSTLPSGCKQLRIQGNKLEGEVPATVKAHANWTAWKPDQYIFPQQEGYGLR